jgi:integral membrane protein
MVDVKDSARPARRLTVLTGNERGCGARRFRFRSPASRNERALLEFSTTTARRRQLAAALARIRLNPGSPGSKQGSHRVQRLFPRNVSPIGRIFVLVAWIEALTWTGLLVGMFLKYATDTTERGVELFGPIHGVAFIAYATVTIAAAVMLRWKWHVALIALLAAIPPLATIAAEYWVSKRGYLGEPVRAETASA